MPPLPIPPMVAQAMAAYQGRDLEPEFDLLQLEAEAAMGIPEPMRAGVAQIQTPTTRVLSPEQEAADEAMERYIAGGPLPPGMTMTPQGRPIPGSPIPAKTRPVVIKDVRGLPFLAEPSRIPETEAVPTQLRPGGIGAPPAVLTSGKLGPTPGPLQQGMRRIAMSRSGPAMPGYLAQVFRESGILEKGRARQIEEFTAPHQEPVATPEGKLIDPEGPGSRRAMMDEFQDLAAKSNKSQAELSRLGQIKDMFAADTAEAKAEEQRKVLQERDREFEEFEQQERDREQAHFEHINTETRKLADLQQEFASAEVDPDRLLGSGGKRIMAGIGIALGAMGAALARTPNYAMQIIGDAIERDIRAQESNLKKLGGRVGMQQSLLGQMRSSFKDESTAKAAARVIMGKAAGRKLDSIRLEYATPEARNQVMALKVAHDQKVAEYTQDFQQKSYEGFQRGLRLRTTTGAQQESWAARRSQAARKATARRAP